MTQHASAHAPEHTAHATPSSAAELLLLLHAMPWCLEHRPYCPAASTGPCTCGAEQLKAEISRLSGLLSA